jgi:hypothetical protein
MKMTSVLNVNKDKNLYTDLLVPVEVVHLTCMLMLILEPVKIVTIPVENVLDHLKENVLLVPSQDIS